MGEYFMAACLVFLLLAIVTAPYFLIPAIVALLVAAPPK